MGPEKLLRIKLLAMITVIAIGLGLLLHNSRSAAQIGTSAVWRDIDASSLLSNTGGARIIKPRRHRTLALDTAGLQTDYPRTAAHDFACLVQTPGAKA